MVIVKCPDCGNEDTKLNLIDGSIYCPDCDKSYDINDCDLCEVDN